jgi:hypothetical protein
MFDTLPLGQIYALDEAVMMIQSQPVELMWEAEPDSGKTTT